MEVLPGLTKKKSCDCGLSRTIIIDENIMMCSRTTVIVLAIFLLLLSVCVAQNENVMMNKLKAKDEKKKRLDTMPLKLAMTAWAEQLTERDYSPEEWKHIFHSSSTSDYFNGYAKKLSKIFKDHKAKVNFAMIGRYSVSFYCLFCD